jgi:hypothetical protein
MQRKRIGQSTRIESPRTIAVVDLSHIEVTVSVIGPIPLEGHYHGLRVDDIGLQLDGRRLLRLTGSVRSVASSLRFIGMRDRAERLLVDYGLPASLPVHRELQA